MTLFASAGILLAAQEYVSVGLNTVLELIVQDGKVIEHASRALTKTEILYAQIKSC